MILPLINLTLVPATEADLERLADLRVAAMRDSLERIGRFDPSRARDRLRKNFNPDRTSVILSDCELAGFYAIRSSPEGFNLDHLYVHPRFQNRGIGQRILQAVFEAAERAGQPVLVGALKESASNRFYQRHGFVKTTESEWDISYIRQRNQAQH